MVRSLASVAGFLALLPSALAGWIPGSTKNLVVYWGQNSRGLATSQQRLSFYCDDPNISVIPIGFLNGITPPMTNFANAGDNCTVFPENPWLLNCPQIEADIKTCQSKGKTILLSIAGDAYTQGGWGSATAAQNAARQVWAMFGPVQAGSTVRRPFGTAVVDGFDLDFEAWTTNLAAFGGQLRSLLDAAGGKKYYLSVAPQCPFPDVVNNDLLTNVAFDWVQIQFYNNWCGVSNFQVGSSTQNAFNFNVWDTWAKGSKNPNTKLLVGIPANTGAGGGYTNGPKLQGALQWSKQYSSFAGVMMWDMSQLWANTGFLNEVVGYLN